MNKKMNKCWQVSWPDADEIIGYYWGKKKSDFIFKARDDYHAEFGGEGWGPPIPSARRVPILDDFYKQPTEKAFDTLDEDFLRILESKKLCLIDWEEWRDGNEGSIWLYAEPFDEEDEKRFENRGLYY